VLLLAAFHRRLTRGCLRLTFFVLTAVALHCHPAASEEFTPALKLAFVSNREHYWYPHVYIYEHDGRSRGRIVTSLQPQDKRLDHQPVLSADGRWCVYGFEMEGEVGRIQGWDLAESKPRDLGRVNEGSNAVFSPSLSADAGLLAFCGWSRAGGSARWDVFLLDLQQQKLLDLPGLNTLEFDERRAAISGDARWLAYSSNADDGAGLTDLRLYDSAATAACCVSPRTARAEPADWTSICTIFSGNKWSSCWD
jgi:hypothetical protein